MTRRREPSFEFLFEKKYQCYECITLGSMDATSEDTVDSIKDLICERIDVPSERGVQVYLRERGAIQIPKYGLAVCNVHGLQSNEASYKAYGIGASTMDGLQLTGENIEYPLSIKLSSVRKNQAFIATFCMVLSPVFL